MCKRSSFLLKPSLFSLKFAKFGPSPTETRAKGEEDGGQVLLRQRAPRGASVAAVLTSSIKSVKGSRHGAAVQGREDAEVG